MALAGGGAPNVAGSNPAGTGSSINYVGTRAYAYSGSVDATNVETTMLEFTTGSELLEGTVQFCYLDTSDDNITYRVYQNSEVILATHGRQASGNQTEPTDAIMQMIIPPFTKIKCTAQNNTATTGRAQSAAIVMRIV